MKSILLNSFVGVLLLVACGEKKGQSDLVESEFEHSNLSGEVLATNHCGRCHAYTEPQLLPKHIWKDEVLPQMGFRMGIYPNGHRPDSLFEPGRGGQIVKRANIYPEEPVLAKADWDKIVDYFLETAPDSVPPPVREQPIRKDLPLFRYREAVFSHRPPLTIMVKILPENRGFVYSDGKKNISSLNFLKANLEKDYTTYLKTTPVHFHQQEDTIYLTTIGTKMYPHDAPNGALQKLYRTQPGGPYKAAQLVIANLQRPVHMAYADLNQDSLPDVVACEYGYLTGKLAWYENTGNRSYRMHPLHAKPGTSKVAIRDVDHDGYPDIIALIAQGDEGIVLYRNRGNGTFEEKKLLSFSPLNGSQYFELADFNDDGLEDIMYVCGDNADYSTMLKDYHGVYIYVNEGDHQYTLAYFFPMNGAYKALARDFDLDGDLDIAAISFFPDYGRYPEESFVYLENQGKFSFASSSFPQATRGRWITMDAGDMDGDGDIDLALGSFVDFYPENDTTGLYERWMTEGPSMIVLENTIR